MDLAANGQSPPERKRVRSAVNRAQDERGAVMVLTALLLPVVVVVGAVSIGSTTLWTAKQDVRRAVDLGALAAAANAPTVNVAGNVVDLPFGLDGEILDAEELGFSDGSGWSNLGCAVARAQLQPGRSVVTNAFSGGVAPEDLACTPTWQWEDPLLAALGGCAADLLAVTDCSAKLTDELRSLSPTLAQETVLGTTLDALLTALAATEKLADDVVADLRALPGQLLADAPAQLGALDAQIAVVEAEIAELQGRKAELEAELASLEAELALLDPLDPLAGTLEQEIAAVEAELAAVEAELAAKEAELADLTAQASDLDAFVAMVENELAPLAHAIADQLEAEHLRNGSVLVSIRLANLLPALLTPRAQVAIDGIDVQPSLSPFSFATSADAVARRAIKSALVLPTAGIPGLVPGIVDRRIDRIAARLGLSEDATVALLQDVGSNGFVLDPNEHLDGAVPRALDSAQAAVEDLQDAIGSRIGDALALTCGGWEVECPAVPGLVSSDRMFGLFRQDLEDATRTAPDGSAPSLDDIVASGHPTWVVSALRGVSLWDVVDPLLMEQAMSLPLLADAVPDLTFIPALDALPVIVGRDPNSGLYTLKPVDLGDVLATRGLYQARLVR